MHQLLENTLAQESADPAFENAGQSAATRSPLLMAAGLVSRRPMRMRSAQIPAVAALLLNPRAV